MAYRKGHVADYGNNDIWLGVGGTYQVGGREEVMQLILDLQGILKDMEDKS